jgi:hypothetical protein
MVAMMPCAMIPERERIHGPCNNVFYFICNNHVSLHSDSFTKIEHAYYHEFLCFVGDTAAERYLSLVLMHNRFLH